MDNSKRRRRKKAKSKMRNIEKAGIIIIIVLVVISITMFILAKTGKDNSWWNDLEQKGYHELKENENPEDIEVQVKASEDYVEPAAGTLDVSKIQGFTEKSVDNSTESETSKSQNPAVTLSDSNLKVEAIGSYSGNFIEDGSDEPILNVAAMLITNNSEQMLQIAIVTFEVNETETASFKVTDLPAGTSTLVLEENKREFKDEDSYTYGEAATGYMEQPTLEEDKFELTTEKGKIILKNKTDQDYDKVYVYYKYVQLGGAYFGGITYRTPFENVPAGGEVEAIAAHFNPDSSKIMAVQIQK